MKAEHRKTRCKTPTRNFFRRTRYVGHLRPAHARAQPKVVTSGTDLVKSSFTTKDRITVLISLFALLLSGLSIYFTFFRNETEVSAAVLSAYGFGSEEKQETTTINVAVMNTGNRQIAVIRSQIYLIQVDRDEWLRQDLQPVDTGADPVVNTLIDPGK